jgi:hypothetical protein
MKNQPKPKVAMKKTVTKVVAKPSSKPMVKKPATKVDSAMIYANNPKLEATRRKSLGVVGRVKEDVKKAVRDLKGSGYGKL